MVIRKEPNNHTIEKKKNRNYEIIILLVNMSKARSFFRTKVNEEAALP